jgi:hypothetical protein
MMRSDCLWFSAFRVARFLDQRRTRDLSRVASKRLSLVLAMEIEPARQATSAREASGTDLQDGARESDLGRRAHRC